MTHTYAVMAPLVLLLSGVFQMWGWNVRQKSFFHDQEEIRQEVIAYRRRKKIRWWNPIGIVRSNNLVKVLQPKSRIHTKSLQKYAAQSRAMSWEAAGWSTLIVGSGIIAFLAFIPS